MSRKLSSKKPSKNINVKSSASSLFLNLIIFFLGLVILYMGYSVFAKLKKRDAAEDQFNKKTASRIVQLEVLNGCGTSGIADKFTEYLRRKNFDVVQMGNYISFDVDKTIVIDRTGNKANAEKVAESLGIDKKNIIQQLNDDYFLDVSLIVGRDYYQLNPYK